MDLRKVQVLDCFTLGQEIGTRLGAGKIEEAKRNARWQIGYILFMSGATVLIMISLIPLMQYIFDFDVAGRDLLAIVMVLQALSLPFFFYSSNVIFITRAGGYTKAPIFITNVPYVLIKAPLVALFIFAFPNVVSTHPALQSFFGFLGLPANLVIFVFLIDRLIEVIRAIIAFIIYHKADWQKDLTRHTSRELKRPTEAVSV